MSKIIVIKGTIINVDKIVYIEKRCEEEFKQEQGKFGTLCTNFVLFIHFDSCAKSFIYSDENERDDDSDRLLSKLITGKE